MKIYLNRQPKLGPWGGGVKTINVLSKSLIERGHTVSYDLDSSVDVIFCLDPRPNDKGVWYQHFLDHRSTYGTKIIQRVGDIGTHSKPELTELVRQTIPLSDHVTYISDWARKTIEVNNQNESVIYLAPLSKFYNNRNKSYQIGEQLKIVTHHWSDNPKKGGSFYKKIDEFLGDRTDGDFEFAFIGRINEELRPRSWRYIEPQNSDAISEILPTFDAYLTASIEEAGGNHAVEALACGLPVIYHAQGGGVTDFCKQKGIKYHDFDSFLTAVEEMRRQYADIKKNVLEYSRTLEETCHEYINIIESSSNKHI